MGPAPSAGRDVRRASGAPRSGVLATLTRATLTLWPMRPPGTSSSSGPIAAGKRIGRTTLLCDGMMKSSGFKAVSIQSMIET